MTSYHVIGARTFKIAELEETEDGDWVIRDRLPPEATIVGFQFYGAHVVVQFALPSVRR